MQTYTLIALFMATFIAVVNTTGYGGVGLPGGYKPKSYPNKPVYPKPVTTAPPTTGPLTTPTPGNWGEWSVCGPCSVSCGSGSCTRTRQCDNPAPGPGGQFCDGQDSDTQQCNGPFQQVNGGWTSWQITGPCSRTCGAGTQQRSRTCSNPAPRCGGAPCPGLNLDTVPCHSGQCPGYGGVGLPGSYKPKSYRNKPVYPKPVTTAPPTTGPLITGNWGEWSVCGPCSVSCGSGSCTRTRQCDNPAPGPGGLFCDGPDSDTQQCNGLFQQVNGGWTSWQITGPCSRTCGAGTQQRSRTCSNPAPRCGGAPCPGLNLDTVPCHYGQCPGYGPSGHHGGGYHHQPPPYHFKKIKSYQYRGGNHGVYPKPVTTDPPTTGPLTTSTPGNWVEWSVCGPCSVSCGSGSCTRTRQCDNPAPGPGGRFCDGPDSDTQQCNGPFQQVNGDWAPWQLTGLCSRTCGDGIQQRLRTCSNPAPRCGGATCLGLSQDTITCNYGLCPVNGQWSQWSACSPCSVTCGQGSCIRRRQCNNPTPANGGSVCQGTDQRPEPCSVLPLPVVGGWTSWQITGQCSRTCGPGTQPRFRTCSNPAPLCGGPTCPGLKSDSAPCNYGPCPVDGQWSQWSSCAPCSVSCGQGSCVRRRLCNNPSPSNGGRLCLGPDQMPEQCTVQPARADGVLAPWTQWTTCTAPCNGGHQSRRRGCSPIAVCGGQACFDTLLENRPCNTQNCTPPPVTGPQITTPLPNKSCKNRCFEPIGIPKKPCQCDQNCSKRYDCCFDFSIHCSRY